MPGTVIALIVVAIGVVGAAIAVVTSGGSQAGKSDRS
jgi:hypothetical protein